MHWAAHLGRAAATDPAGRRENGSGSSHGQARRRPAHIDANLDAALERLFALLRIKSISTDPAYAGECRACADWHVGGSARASASTASARDTPGHPIVVGHDRSAPGPSALFYGHYDVQPVDPLDLWDHDPSSRRSRRGPTGRR